jgi:D-psicose/D-tagatose/L-ribulose 3-epimerase
MPSGRELVAADHATVRETQDYLRACVDAAVAVGSGVVAGPIYASVGRRWRLAPGEYAATLQELAANLRGPAEYAAQRGVRLALEPLNRFETSLLTTAADAAGVVDLVGSPGLGLLLDTFHMNIEERDPAAAVRLAGPRLAHFHACANDRGAPGTDHLDWPALALALSEIGYEGAVVIESFTPENETIATAAAVWRSLAPSQDAIATDGLAFLRALLTKGSP